MNTENYKDFGRNIMFPVLVFTEDAELEFIESYDEETDDSETADETFSKGEILEVDILDETDDTISIQVGDGSVCYQITKSVVDVVRTQTELEKY